MADELQGAAVAVLPVLSGSGMKNKVLEALATGTPVVANRLGVRGVEGVVDGRHVLLAEDAEAMAAACVRLLRDVDCAGDWRRTAASSSSGPTPGRSERSTCSSPARPRAAPVARAPAAATALAGRRSP